MNSNTRELFNKLISQLTINEPREEKEAIIRWVLEHELNLKRTDILVGREISYDANRFDEIIQRLNRHEPVQYIFGETPFYGRTFKVSPAVLIPRSETEVLIKTVKDHFKNSRGKITLLDIGTGSGCIATTLALEIPESEVYATDISDDALALARENAKALNARVIFTRHDILKEPISLQSLDAVVSNPPYVPEQERSTLRENVVNYEPHLALFSGGDSALIFYEVIAQKAWSALRAGGLLITEINEHYGPETGDLFMKKGYTQVRIHKDLTGRDRIVSGIR